MKTKSPRDILKYGSHPYQVIRAMEEMRMRHTPGPWEIVTFMNEYKKRGVIHIDQSGDHGQPDIAMITSPFNGLGSEQNFANAALIAAAPELLAIVKTIYDDYTSSIKTQLPLEVVSALKLLIDKAEGKERRFDGAHWVTRNPSTGTWEPENQS